MTEVLAPRIKMLNVTVSIYESVEVGTFSAGILLTDPIPKLKTVTATEVVINRFSNASCTVCGPWSACKRH